MSLIWAVEGKNLRSEKKYTNLLQLGNILFLFVKRKLEKDAGKWNEMENLILNRMKAYVCYL